MYVNKCTKCGAEFETKNPKRVICPNCLYPERKPDEETTVVQEEEPKSYPRSYSAGDDNNFRRPYQQQNRGGYNRDNYGNREGGYNRDNYQQNYNGGGYNRGGYNRDNYGNREGGYNRDSRQQNYSGGGYNQGGYNRRPNNNFNRGNGRPQQGRFNRPQGGGRQGGFQQRRPMNKRPGPPKQLLVSKEQLFQIEELYKKVLPLPNPDIHEVIGQAIELEPRKVFFGINLVRQKMFLPKLPFPKRKLAVSAEQLAAIKMLYEPLLPLPPIGCHKIIAIQLKMDEWRVHVGIGIVRKQMGLERWNEGRPDAPPPKVSSGKSEAAEVSETTPVVAETENVAEPVVVEEVKPKRTRKKKTETEVTEDATSTTSEQVEEKPKRTRKKKVAEEET